MIDGSPFDLATFVVGSEGTLAIATEAVVGLVPKPKHTVFAVGHFDSTQHAIEATTDALSLDPAQVELMDKTILDLSRRKIEYADLGNSLVGDPAALLFVSFTGDDRDEVAHRLDELIALWQANGHGYHILRAVTPAQQGALLKVRKSSLGLLMAASEGANRPLAFVEDTAVPPERLAAYTARFAEILDSHQMRAGFYGHCSVGCLHIRPFVDLSRPDEIARMRAVAVQIKDLVREFGGVNSSEHGDGLARSEFNREIFGDELYEAMRSVKQLFDPQNLLNPGKIVDAPPMTENLRDAALPPPVPFRTRLDFERGRRDARGGRPLHEHRPVPQEHHRCHVPLLHRHPRGGARHPRAGQRAGEGPVGTGPGGGAGRRAAARDPRSLPDVQGVQGRVPAGRGHGQAQERDPVAPPRAARDPAALAGVRRHPHAQPPRVGHRAALQPARRVRPAARAAGPGAGHRPAAAAAAVRAAEPAPLVPPAPAGGRRARADAGHGELPRRLVHLLHRAAHRADRGRPAGGGRLGRSSW